MVARCFVLFLLLASFHLVLAQADPSNQFGSVHVKILDAGSDQPVPYANVYINRTTIGGYTNDQGEVTIRRIPFGTHELVITSIGHKPQQRTLVIKADQSIHITAKLVQRMLNEVSVTANRDKKWHRQLARFEKLFFGTLHYKKCKIDNPWVLDFKTVNGSFIASAKEPLKIANNYLGYYLEFHIKTCDFNTSKFVITGLVRFEEKSGNDSIAAIWKKNREEAYRGSAQHFLRAVVDSSLTREGYEIYSDLTSDADIIRGSSFIRNVGTSILYDSIAGRVKPNDDGIYTIDFPSRLEVHYMRKRAKMSVYRDIYHPISWVEVMNGKLGVSRDGVVQNPASLTLLGAMSNLRVAEWLPLNYQYRGTDEIIPVTKPVEVKLALLEKPYIQTDRSYYYNNETVWLKGYMSYAVPMLKDTLSQAIYIDLVDNTGKTVSTKRYRVGAGAFNGDIQIDKDWKPGLYQLRAYTAWMLNFDPRLIFTKTISLLGQKEAVRIVSDYKLPTDTLPNIWLNTDKIVYSPREKVTVTIDVTDSLDFPIVSNLSMSVTDLDQAVPQKNEKTILANYLYDEVQADSTTQIKYDIEYGIPFNGNFWLGKKPAQGSITVFQENIKETFAIITDEGGRFRRTLSFTDTASFYLRAFSYNNKRGRVVMDTRRPQPPQLEIEPLSLDIFSSDAINRARLNISGVTMLEEVSVKANKIVQEAPRPVKVIHGSADYTVDGDWINDHNFVDPLAAIAAKVPGIRYSPNPPGLTFTTGQFATLGGPGATPLVLVDGIEITDLAQILDVPIRSIDFIDVLKFGSTAAYGNRGSNGVIAIYTKNRTPRDPNDTSFDKSKLQAVRLSGFSTPTEFTAPDYSKPSSNDYYDYRATINWTPSIKTDGKNPATVHFYAADVATKYRIIVEGVTINGTPVRAEKIIGIVNGR